MNTPPLLSTPPKLRRGAYKKDEWVYIDAGRDLLAHMCTALGLDSLAASRILDMGCGTKFTQAILNYDIAVGEYIGVDVYRETIDFLAPWPSITSFADPAQRQAVRSSPSARPWTSRACNQRVVI